MKMRSSKLLSVLLAIVMVLSTFGIVSFAEETETTPAQTEYYAKAGATGDGRTAETPAGSLATVIKAINDDGHTTGDNVTVYIMRGDNEVFVYTPDTLADMPGTFLAYSATAHKATVTYTSFDAENNSSMVFKDQYVMSGYTGTHLTLAGPTVFKNMNLIDTRVGTANDIVCDGYDLVIENVVQKKAKVTKTVAAGETLPNGETAAENTAVETSLLVDAWNGHIRLGTNKTTNSGRGATVIVDDPSQIQDVCMGSYQATVAAMKNASTVTAYIGSGTLSRLYLDTAYGSADLETMFNIYEKDVNVILDGTKVTALSFQNTGSKGVTIKGALQIIYNNGAAIGSDNVKRYSDEARTQPLTNEYHIYVNEGITLDVTETAGTYNVSDGKFAYAVSENGEKVYYSADGVLTVKAPGKYNVYTAESIEAMEAALTIPTTDKVGYAYPTEWTVDEENRCYSVELYKIAPTTATYYAKFGGTGDGSSIDNPAPNIATIIATANAAGHIAGDTVTVKIINNDDLVITTENEDGTTTETTVDYVEQLNYDENGTYIKGTSFAKNEFPNGRVVYWSSDGTTTENYAWKLVIESYDNTKIGYMSQHPKIGYNSYMNIHGTTVLRDINYIINRNVDRELYANGNYLELDNVNFYYYNGDNSATRSSTYKGLAAGHDVVVLATSSNKTSFKGATLVLKSPMDDLSKIDKYGVWLPSKYKSTFSEAVNLYFDHSGIKTYLFFGSATAIPDSGVEDRPAVLKDGLNIVINNVNTLTAVGKVQSVTVTGGLQVIANNGESMIDIPTNVIADETWLVSIDNAADCELDITDTNGKYSVSDNIAYYVDTENKKIYYWDDVVDLTPFGAGTYSLGSAANIQAIPVPDCIEIADDKRFAGWIEEDPENPGVLVAQIVDKTNNYYVQYGATGSGRSPEFPIGTIPNVIKLINADGLDADDEATVYLVPTGNEPTNEQLNYSSAKQGEAPIKVDTPNGFISYIAPNIAHSATITYTTYNYDATKDNKMILANGDTVKSNNGRDGTGHMYLCGPTVFKDIYVIDIRMDNAAWDFYTQSHDFEMINVDWRRTTGKWENGVASGTPGYTHNPWNNHLYGGNHGNKNNNYSPATDADFEVHIDNADFLYDLSLGSRVNQDGTVKAGVSTYRIGNDTKTSVIEELYVGTASTTTIAQQDGTINAIFNNTTINNSKYSSKKTTNSETGEETVTEYIPVITNVQLLLNNGSVLKANNTKLDGNLYILTAGEGVELDITETVGTYTVDVAEGMYAIATDGANKYYSVIADGVHTLTVPKGTYTVTATAPYSYENGVVTALVNGANIDLAELETENTGKIFLGWTLSDESYVDLAGSTVITLDAGETCTASYKEFTFETEESDMYVLGAQIRITYAENEESSDVADLRFISQIKKSFLAEQFDINEYIGGEDVKYGHIVLPAEEKYRAEGEMLEIGKVTSKGHSPEKVPAVKIYDNEGDFVKFTVCLTDILPAKYGRCFAVRPYVCYTDKNGVEQYIYGEQYETASLVTVAQAGKAKAEEDGTEIPEIISAILESVVTE